MRVDIVAGKESLRIAIAFFYALQIPKFTTLDIEEDLAAQIGAANAEENDGINAVAYFTAQFFQRKNPFRAVDVPIDDIRQLRE